LIPFRFSVDAHLRHDALVYHSDDEMIGAVVPYLEAGIASGAPTVAVMNRSNWAMLRDALGPASSQVSYTDCDAFYTRPIKAIAAYDATLRSHAASGHQPARVVGELPWGPTEREWREWTGYEALLNRALAHHDATVLCTYNARVLPSRLITAAYQTHPHVVNGPREASAFYEYPEELLGALAMPAIDVPDLPLLQLCEDVETYRERLSSALAAASVPHARALDLLLAATELFTNACTHGGGPTSLAAGTVDGWFVCEVSDAGPGLHDPLAGYVPPGESAGRGSGLWVARQLVSRLELIALEPGLKVRLWL
jgi:anti-sigma regulatory factor (Ser/Thr protein kinase)